MKRSDDEIFSNRYYIINKRLLKLISVWPYQNKSVKILIRIFIILSIHTMMIPQVIRAFEEWYEEDRNIEIIVENFCGFLYFQGVLGKLYANIICEKQLRIIYENITKDMEEITDEGERSVMRYYWNFGRLLTILYCSYVLSAGVFFSLLPAFVPLIMDVLIPLNESRPQILCYYAEYYIDQQEYLYPLVFHTLICVFLTVSILASLDSSFLATVYHVLGLFYRIMYRMENLSELIDNDFKNISKNGKPKLEEYIVDCIKFHKTAIEYAELIRTTYNLIFFYMTGLVLVAMSVGTIIIVMNLDNPTNLIRVGFLWCGAIIYMFYTMWPGQAILNCSDDFYISIYKSEWHRLPLKHRFLIQFMMMRAYTPCQFTAGPLLQMNFRNCGLVLKTAFSYFTVLSTFS